MNALRQLKIESATVVRFTPAAELDLIARWRADEPAAWNEIYRTYVPRLTAIADRIVKSRQDAEEMAHDALRAAHRRLDTFRGDAGLATWLWRIVRNLALNRSEYNRRRRRGETVSLEWSPSEDCEPLGNTIPDQRPSVPACVEFAELRAKVSAALPALAPHHRELIEHRMQGDDYLALAALQRIPLGSIKSRLARARAELRRRIS
jgi:RNA polymerase sigma-70 factor (ECF subfamily)